MYKLDTLSFPSFPYASAFPLYMFSCAYLYTLKSTQHRFERLKVSISCGHSCHKFTSTVQHRRKHNTRTTLRPQCGLDYFRPKPSHSLTAISKRSFSLSRLAYSGSSRVLKHVCAVGRLSLSGPILWIRNGKCRNPPIGALWEPVVKVSNLCCVFVSISCTICQKSRIK